MADSKKNEIPSLFGDTLKSIVDALSDDGKSSKKSSSAKKTTTEKKTTSGKSSTAKKSTTAKKTSTAKKTTTAKKSTTAAKKTTTAKKSTTTKKTTGKKVDKIIFEIGGKQIDMKQIEKKAAKFGGTVYVVANERKIYDSEGNSINLF